MCICCRCRRRRCRRRPRPLPAAAAVGRPRPPSSRPEELFELAGNAFQSGCVAAELMAAFCALGAAYNLKDRAPWGGGM
eukprot:4807703-Pyramimonas_sp.AAC.4